MDDSASFLPEKLKNHVILNKSYLTKNEKIFKIPRFPRVPCGPVDPCGALWSPVELCCALLSMVKLQSEQDLQACEARNIDLQAELSAQREHLREFEARGRIESRATGASTGVPRKPWIFI